MNVGEAMIKGVFHRVKVYKMRQWYHGGMGWDGIYGRIKVAIVINGQTWLCLICVN